MRCCQSNCWNHCCCGCNGGNNGGNNGVTTLPELIEAGYASDYPLYISVPFFLRNESTGGCGCGCGCR